MLYKFEKSVRDHVTAALPRRVVLSHKKQEQTNRKMSHPTTLATLFVSPKRGGILQSSGFLDLKSLMALSRTCKANMIDEQSLTLFIESEITRQHGVDTMEEAIDFLRNIYRWSSFKRWLQRDYQSILVSKGMLSFATLYEVMLAKMLRTVPTESERYQLVSEKDKHGGGTLLHYVTRSRNPESIRTVLALYPESEHLNALSLQDNDGRTVLHCAVIYSHVESTKLILTSFPAEERLQAVCGGSQGTDRIASCCQFKKS